MSNKIHAGLACLILLGLFGSAFCLEGSAAEPMTYLLRFKFSPQQELLYVSQNDAEYLVEYAQAKDTVKHTSMSLRQITVLNESPDGTAEVQLKIVRAYMTAQNAGVDSIYDSTQTNNVPTEFARVHESIETPLTARISPLGKVLPAADKTATVDQVDLLFLLPEQPIPVGEIWKDNYEASILAQDGAKLFRQIKMQRRFQLQAVENGIATISATTVCISPLNDPFQESQLLQRKANGTLKFDIEHGRLIDRQVKVEDKVIGNQGPGSALAVKIVRVDRLLSKDQLSQLDLTKPIVPVRVAAAPVEAAQP